MQAQPSLIQDVPTRWNSTLDMGKRLIRKTDAVTAALDQQNHKLVMLTQQEWDRLQRLESLREPCKEEIHSNVTILTLRWTDYIQIIFVYLF